MALTRDIFVAQFPEFGHHSPDSIVPCLRQANREVSPVAWMDEEERVDAAYWLAAHLLAVRVREVGMATGAVPAKQFQSGAQFGEELLPFHLAPLATTLYGREFTRREQSRLGTTIGFCM